MNESIGSGTTTSSTKYQQKADEYVNSVVVCERIICYIPTMGLFHEIHFFVFSCGVWYYDLHMLPLCVCVCVYVCMCECVVCILLCTCFQTCGNKHDS